MADRIEKRTRVLFVCVGNACRSQMAEALARHFTGDLIEPSSAGLVPFGAVVTPTRLALSEVGVGINGQYAKGVFPELLEQADLIVNLTGRPASAVFRGQMEKVEDWQVTDPFGEDLEVYRHIRDEISQRVQELAQRLRQQRQAAEASQESAKAD